MSVPQSTEIPIKRERQPSINQEYLTFLLFLKTQTAIIKTSLVSFPGKDNEPPLNVRSENEMKSIGKIILFPLVIAIFGAALYIWKRIHVWPPGKEGWLEESMYMMAFHAFCLVVLLPLIIWAIAQIWSNVSGMKKLTAIVSGFILLACTVILPELIIKKSERRRPNHTSEGSRQPVDEAPRPSM